jgi:hypothetical protein
MGLLTCTVDIVLFLYSWKGGNRFSTRMVPKLQITSGVRGEVMEVMEE